MDNLKPCPFCGGNAKYKEFNDGFLDVYRVACESCGIFKSVYEAISTWNKRACMCLEPKRSINELLEACKTREEIDNFFDNMQEECKTIKDRCFYLLDYIGAKTVHAMEVDYDELYIVTKEAFLRGNWMYLRGY